MTSEASVELLLLSTELLLPFSRHTRLLSCSFEELVEEHDEISLQGIEGTQTDEDELRDECGREGVRDEDEVIE